MGLSETLLVALHLPVAGILTRHAGAEPVFGLLALPVLVAGIGYQVRVGRVRPHRIADDSRPQAGSSRT